MLKTLDELAGLLDAAVTGDGSLAVRALVHPREAACPEDLVFVADPAVFTLLAESPAICAVVPEGVPVPQGLLKGYLSVARPRMALARLLAIFDKPVHAYAGIHPTAVVDSSATIGLNVSIGPYVSVGKRARVGDGTILMSHISVGAEAVLGECCLLHPGVRIGERVRVGDRVIIHHNASLGADGFSFVTPEAGSVESARANRGGETTARNTEIVRINSVGTVIVEDDVEIGANAAIDRATLGATRIGRGTKIDNLVQIGHNNTIGQNCLIVSQAGIAGSCQVGDRVVIAGQAGLADHLTVGDDAIIAAQAGVTKAVSPHSIVIGSPAVPHRQFAETLAYQKKLKSMARELETLHQRLALLEERLAGEAPPAPFVASAATGEP